MNFKGMSGERNGEVNNPLSVQRARHYCSQPPSLSSLFVLRQLCQQRSYNLLYKMFDIKFKQSDRNVSIAIRMLTAVRHHMVLGKLKRWSSLWDMFN